MGEEGRWARDHTVVSVESAKDSWEGGAAFEALSM